MRFVDLFAGLGGFHVALSSLGHECVFASEIDPELAALYESNFRDMKKKVYGDIRQVKSKIPKHDILCAGFPCQPFSKSGAQRGFADRTRGTLFHEIIEVIEMRRPRFIVLENVGNFERHDGGETWRTARGALEDLGYYVRGTEHKASGGHGLISPHHLGFPHTRERFYILASLDPLPTDPFPRAVATQTSLREIEQSLRDMNALERGETKLPEHRVRCIDHWNKLLKRIPAHVELPSFPIWGDEVQARYPYRERTPFSTSIHDLRRAIQTNGDGPHSKRELLAQLPSYARSEMERFPGWKVAFIRQNRDWFEKIEKYTTKKWIEDLRSFPPSHRKLEWNCKGEERDLWEHVLQFRPSGLRVKRYSAAPALVAMTSTQIPILGPKRRYISRVEGLRLQGFRDTMQLPVARDRAFQALGNAVHAGVVKAIAATLINEDAAEKKKG